MQCSFKTALVAYVYKVMTAHLLISNSYPAYFQKGPGVADKIRQRHNKAIKRNQRSSPQRKKGLPIIAQTWVNIAASIIYIYILAFGQPFRMSHDRAPGRLGILHVCSSISSTEARPKRTPGKSLLNEWMSEWTLGKRTKAPWEPCLYP